MKERIQSYKDLKMWQKSKDFAVAVYRATEKFPKQESYGLTNQLRRAAVSIPSNIAEGFQRFHTKEKVQFLRIAFGSGAEIETQLMISCELGYISQQEFNELNHRLEEILKIINVVINKL